MTWQERNIAQGQAMIDYALSNTPEPPLEALGDRPPLDRHMMYETDFNALVDLEVQAGRVTQAAGDLAVSSFHVYISGTRFPSPQTPPKFYQ